MGPSNTPHVNIGGKELIHYCSGNYLGLADDERLKSSAKEAIDKYGVGTTGSRIVSGTLDIHKKLEKRIASYLGKEDAVFVATGFIINESIIPALFNMPQTPILGGISDLAHLNRGCIFSDELNHASIIDGCRLAKAEIVVYKHRDMDDLRAKLVEHSSVKNKLIVSDGVFSMDGDTAPLEDLARLKDEFGAMLMVDDAHGVGVLGEHGKGSWDLLGVDPSNIDLVMGTFSKAFGVNGGYVAADKRVIDYLRIGMRSFIFSGAPAAALSAAILSAIEIIDHDPKPRTNLLRIVKELKEGFLKMGFTVIDGESQIIPIFIGDEKKCINFAQKLFDRGIFVAAMRWPATPHNKSRIRLTPMATHLPEDIQQTLGAFQSVGRELGLIK